MHFITNMSYIILIIQYNVDSYHMTDTTDALLLVFPIQYVLDGVINVL